MDIAALPCRLILLRSFYLTCRLKIVQIFLQFTSETFCTNMCYKIILDVCVIVDPCFRIYIWNVILNEYGSFLPFLLVSAYNATGCRLAVVVVTVITHEVFLMFICRLVVVMLIMQSPQINPAAKPRHRLRERCRPMGRTRNPSLTESCRMGWMGCPTGSCHAQ